MKTIGITIGLKDNNENLWSNGIKLNVLYIAKLLKNSNKYNIILLNTTSKDINQYSWDTSEFPIYHIDDKINDIDFLISIGGQINYNQTKILKNNNVKIVSYACGNEYVIRMEQALFHDNFDGKVWANPGYDEIWVVPQNFEHNYYMFKQLHNIENVKSVPFIWDSYILDMMNSDGSLDYYNKSDKKSIAIMEANTNVLKYCLYPMLIVNDVYKKNPELIDKLHVNNTYNLRKKKVFIDYVNHLKIHQDGNVSYNDRFQTNEFLKKYSDIVVSHQWDNPLNYFYMDIAYFGYPILHNANMCKDIGYYYNRFDGDQAAEKLLWIIKNHDNNIDEYKTKNRNILYRYSANNPTNIEFYVNSIEKLMNK